MVVAVEEQIFVPMGNQGVVGVHGHHGIHHALMQIPQGLLLIGAAQLRQIFGIHHGADGQRGRGADHPNALGLHGGGKGVQNFYVPVAVLLGKAQGLIGAAADLNDRGAAEGGVQKDLSVLLLRFRGNGFRGFFGGYLRHGFRGPGGSGNLRHLHQLRQLSLYGDGAVAVKAGQHLGYLQPALPAGEGVRIPQGNIVKKAAGEQRLPGEGREFGQFPFFVIGDGGTQGHNGGDDGESRQHGEKGNHQFGALPFCVFLLIHNAPQNWKYRKGL